MWMLTLRLGLTLVVHTGPLGRRTLAMCSVALATNAIYDPAACGKSRYRASPSGRGGEGGRGGR
eukprot:4826006-Pyramimonas_sp.AAC.1